MSLNRSLWIWFKSGLNKWRLAFLIFAAVYTFFLLLNLSYMSIQWDEVTHLNGGMLLLRGNFQTYFTNNSFYPPMYNIFTTAIFSVAGINVFNGRLVSVIFSLLSLYALFEFGYRMYGAKTALLASIFLGLMPGYVWLSRMAMIETTLIFFFMVSALLFFSWLQSHQNKFLIASGLMLGLGILVKYQTILVVAIMLTSLFFLSRGYIKKKLRRLPVLILIVTAVVIPWVLISYQLYASGMLNAWLYALGVGNPDKTLYSTGLGRFPQPYASLPGVLQIPVFYLFEMTVPYPNVHPISFFLYLLGLAGLGWFAWRRKATDKYLLIWFFAVYIFFTIIPNRQWRYMVPAFPILALSAANLLTSALAKAQSIWRTNQLSINKKRLTQIAAGLLIVFTLVGTTYSLADAYSWVSKDQIHIPIQEATDYAAAHLAPNQSIMVMCAQNLFSQDMVQFYLNSQNKYNQVWQYPELPVDTYTPNFNITEFINECQQHNVKYVFTYEYGGTVPYFNTTLSLMGVYQMLYESGKFQYLSGNAMIENLVKEGLIPAFGTNPRRIFVLTFLG